MDPEIIKTATELAKATGTAAGLSIPFTGIVKRMLGPAADELAEMWRDQVRLYRYERQLKCVQKAEKMAEEAGFVPQAVPPKILFPLLEGASFEDDENLHDMWAALLANAASPEHSPPVRPAFIAILKQIASDEAHLLKAVSDITDHERWELTPAELHERPLGAFPRLPGEVESAAKQRFDVCSATLEGMGLIKVGNFGIERASALGRTFVEACRQPTPKGNS